MDNILFYLKPLAWRAWLLMAILSTLPACQAQLAYPQMFGLLLLWPMLWYFERWQQKRRLKRLQQWASVAALKRSLPRFLQQQHLLSATMRLLAALCLIVALWRPQYGFVWQELPTLGEDVLIILDVSRSMLVSDGDRTQNISRLTRAKRAIHDLSEDLAGNRLGLITFAGEAFLQCPLTVDPSALQLFLDDANTESISSAGSSLQAAIEVALKALEKHQSQGQNIVLFSDGEELQGRVLDAAEQAAQKQIRIFTVGVGSQEGAPVPAAHGEPGFTKDESGKVVMSRKHQQTLQAIANVTSGYYVDLETSPLAIDSLAKTILQNSQAGQENSANSGSNQPPRKRVYQEQFFGFILAAWLLLMAESLSPSFYQRRQKPLAPLAFLAKKPTTGASK